MYFYTPKFLAMDANFLQERNRFMLNQSALLGLIYVVFLLILYFSGKLFSASEKLSFLIWVGFIYYSSIKYRDKFFDGFIQFEKIFSYGLRLMVLSGIISGFFYFVLLKIDVELYSEQIDNLLELYSITGFYEGRIEEFESVLYESFPQLMFFSSILSSFFYGIVVSLIIAIFVKRKKIL